MKQVITYLIAFLFIFTVTERSGISVSNTDKGKPLAQHDPIHENEDAEKSSENSTESFKEYWHSVAVYLIPPVDLDSFIRIPSNKSYAWSFYPSIPTPPPDAGC